MLARFAFVEGWYLFGRFCGFAETQPDITSVYEGGGDGFMEAEL